MERLELEGNSTLSDDDIIPQVAEGMGAGDNWKPVIVDFAGEQLSFAIIQRWPAFTSSKPLHTTAHLNAHATRLVILHYFTERGEI